MAQDSEFQVSVARVWRFCGRNVTLCYLSARGHRMSCRTVYDTVVSAAAACGSSWVLGGRFFTLGQNLEYRSIYVPQVADRVEIGATAELLLVLRAPHTP